MRNVCKYSLWKRLTAMKYKKATGFVGWVTYETKDKESEWNKITCMLARYAEFANIGAKNRRISVSKVIQNKGEKN